MICSQIETQALQSCRHSSRGRCNACATCLTGFTTSAGVTFQVISWAYTQCRLAGHQRAEPVLLLSYRGCVRLQRSHQADANLRRWMEAKRAGQRCSRTACRCFGGGVFVLAGHVHRWAYWAPIMHSLVLPASVPAFANRRGIAIFATHAPAFA